MALLNAVIGFVRDQGGRIVEAYPIDPAKGSVPPVFAWHGLLSACEQAGFTECLRRSETRPIVRYTIEDAPSSQ